MTSTLQNPHLYSNYADPQAWVIPQIILSQAKRQPKRVAIHFINGPDWTYQEVLDQALHGAGWLKAQGITADSAVALMADDPQTFCQCWLGLAMLGATMVAINTSVRGDPLRHQLTLAEVTDVLAEVAHFQTTQTACGRAQLLSTEQMSSATTTPLAQSDIHPAKHNDTSCIMFTSGTSGPAKGVMMPHAHCVLFAVGTIDNYHLHAEHVFYICLPLFHANGLFMQLLACLLSGAPAVLRPRFSASQWLADIRRYSITHTNMLGALAAFVAAQPPTPQDSDHQLQVIGSAPLPASAEKTLRIRFNVPHVIPLYGMTEVNIPLYGRLDEQAPSTCGRLYAEYFEVEIRNPESDESIPQGGVGEIMVRPRQPFGFMAGYVGMPEKTLEAWRNFWFHTGDAGRIDSRGRFVFVDRIKDCIRRRGENISSYEVEQAFLALEDIAEAAAYAVPAAGGEGMEDEVMVALETKAGTESTPEKWLEQAAPNLPRFAIPRYLRIVDALPKTPTGKIRKVQLRTEGVTADSFENIL